MLSHRICWMGTNTSSSAMMKQLLSILFLQDRTYCQSRDVKTYKITLLSSTPLYHAHLTSKCNKIAWTVLLVDYYRVGFFYHQMWAATLWSCTPLYIAQNRGVKWAPGRTKVHHSWSPHAIGHSMREYLWLHWPISNHWMCNQSYATSPHATPSIQRARIGFLCLTIAFGTRSFKCTAHSCVSILNRVMWGMMCALVWVCIEVQDRRKFKLMRPCWSRA